MATPTTVPDLWGSWLDSWELILTPSSETPPPEPLASSRDLCSTQKTSGLFNKGDTDVTDSLFASVEISNQLTASCTDADMTTLMTTDAGSTDAVAGDLLSLLGGGVPGAGDLSGLAALGEGLPDVSLDGLEHSLNLAEGGGDFLEVFTNLNDLLADPKDNVPFGDIIDLGDAQIDSSPAGSTVCPSLDTQLAPKRTAAEAFSSSTSPNRDHDYYTSKASGAKKPRLSEASCSASVSDDESIPDVRSPEDKYRSRRDKNNIASRRSRESRKQKYVLMEEQAKELELENAQLRIKIEDLEALTKKMKDALVHRLAQK